VPRETIAMTRAELLAFLAAQRWMALATLDADGTPSGELAPVRLAGERLRFAVARGSRAHENVVRDARVACAADEFPSYHEIRGATVHGAARACEGPGEPGPDWVEYELALDDVASFDFRKMRRTS
jgi:hypothetical protein